MLVLGLPGLALSLLSDGRGLKLNPGAMVITLIWGVPLLVLGQALH
ncbi:hypothetical protein [Elongatibacter sediminis]|uniref:Uncharacterized protein n=1 Tax=Elongatibacter sediminis TaxID=3119006 RepID=A0AAW9R622_9GAMM